MPSPIAHRPLEIEDIFVQNPVPPPRLRRHISFGADQVQRFHLESPPMTIASRAHYERPSILQSIPTPTAPAPVEERVEPTLFQRLTNVLLDALTFIKSRILCCFFSSE